MTFSPEELEQIRQHAGSGFPFSARTEVKVLALEKGYTKMLMPFAPNQNHVGMMYAGALFTLSELPGGVIYMSSFDISKYYPIVKDMSIRFRRPATTDITVEVRVDDDFVEKIQKEAEENGKADYEWECELKDASGEVVAISKNTYQLRKIGM